MKITLVEWMEKLPPGELEKEAADFLFIAIRETGPEIISTLPDEAVEQLIEYMHTGTIKELESLLTKEVVH